MSAEAHRTQSLHPLFNGAHLDFHSLDFVVRLARGICNLAEGAQQHGPHFPGSRTHDALAVRARGPQQTGSPHHNNRRQCHHQCCVGEGLVYTPFLAEVEAAGHGKAVLLFNLQVPNVRRIRMHSGVVDWDWQMQLGLSQHAYTSHPG
jgi:hypothetical protein